MSGFKSSFELSEFHFRGFYGYQIVSKKTIKKSSAWKLEKFFLSSSLFFLLLLFFLPILLLLFVPSDANLGQNSEVEKLFCLKDKLATGDVTKLLCSSWIILPVFRNLGIVGKKKQKNTDNELNLSHISLAYLASTHLKP